MPLEEYRRKRDFTTTPEPAGEPGSPHPGAARFVIHKHAARALHYDLRLEIGGVYASWAVPKGPSLDTHDRHLAVHVEDHPLEYGEFEGVIPAGEYGGGTVMIWDRGEFLPLEDPAEGVAKGNLKFRLVGTKLNGSWALVRMKPRPGERQEAWLLIKERDDAVRPHDDYDVLAALPDSAATGRTMDEIAADGETWQAPAQPTAAKPTTPAKASGDTEATDSPDPFPADAPVQLATLVTAAPDGDEWLHEVKYDGYRLRIALRDGVARVLTRNSIDWTDRFPTLAAAVKALPVSSALLDGEAVVTDAEGKSDFGGLQAALASGNDAAITFQAFDLLYLDGHDLRAETLVRRKTLLTALIATAPSGGPLRYVDHIAGHGPAYHDAACHLLLEGSVSKRSDRPWVGGRTRDWLKVKCIARQEFVIGGWTDPEGARSGFGALLVGVRDAEGGLQYAGRVGTGFTEQTLAELRSRLDLLATDTPAFSDPPAEKHVHWVRPELVAEVAFREWTREGVVRQASFKGLRDDRDPMTVVRERPAETVATDTPPDPDVPSDPKRAGRLVVAGVTITNPDRVLEPAGITKLDLARYYERVASWMLPHAANRLLTVVRCPRASDDTAACFYQKHPETRGWPSGFEPVTVMDKDGPGTYFYLTDAAGIVALAQLGTLEIHTWGSRASDPERPDRIIFDLDPGPEVALDDVKAAALLVREALRSLGIPSFVKTTGGHGLHVVAPIAPDRTFDEARAFAKSVVDALVAQHPDRLIGRMAKAERIGRVFIDYLRNAHGATAVCAFSTRARPGGLVSVPVAWDELADVDPTAFDIRSVPEQLERLTRDPWDGYDAAPPHLPARS